VSVGRNEPCPCGSGKKFKKCCYAAERPGVSSAQPRAYDATESFWSARSALERERCPRFLGNLLAASAMIDDWLAESRDEATLSGYFEAEATYAGVLERAFGEGAAIHDFLRVRSPYDLDVRSSGRPAASLFLDRFRDALPADAVRALEALLEGEDAFAAVERQGSQRSLRRLSDGRVLPVERTAGRSGDIVLGRLVEIGGHFCLFTPEKVSGFRADECVELAERLTGARKTLKRLGLTSRKPGFAIQLMAAMLQSEPPVESRRQAEEPARQSEGRGGFPVIVNADGHAAVLTCSSFDVLDFDRLASELARPQWNADTEIERDRAGKARKLTAVLSRRPRRGRDFPTGDIILATLRAEGRTLRLETNSAERDREVRSRLGKLPPGILRFEGTTSRPIHEELAKPVSKQERRRAEVEQEELARNPEVRARLGKMLREYSKRWCDTAVPALGNRRPRSLVRTEKGRARVVALIEQMESRPEPGGMGGMDFELIRRELKLPSAR
jgi:hypothetical protein